MIHLPVAHLVYGGVTLVTGGEVVQHKGEVVYIGLHFAGLFQTVRVLIQSPRQHGGGVCHGQVELHVVAGIIPAAGDFVRHGGVGTPFHLVPVRERTCLLALIEVEGLLHRLCIVSGKIRRRHSERRAGQRTQNETSGSERCRQPQVFPHLHHLPFLRDAAKPCCVPADSGPFPPEIPPAEKSRFPFYYGTFSRRCQAVFMKLSQKFTVKQTGFFKFRCIAVISGDSVAERQKCPLSGCCLL